LAPTDVGGYSCSVDAVLPTAYRFVTCAVVLSSFHSLLCLILLALGLTSARAGAAETFRVASYNVQNYLLTAQGGRNAKSTESKQAVHDMILACKPDVLALQEIGSAQALEALRVALAGAGLDLPHSEFVSGYDTNIHVAVLSRFPFARRRAHTNDSYMWFGKEQRVRRGFAELEVQVNSEYTFTLFVAHLKSPIDWGKGGVDEAREQEALTLRRHVDAVFASRAEANLIVAGDFNDTPDSRSVRGLIGRRNALIDLRPAERNAGEQGKVAWSHHFATSDSYQRIDYLLASRGMAREWSAEGTFVVAHPMWALASDHRPVVATFVAENR
jgi:endonuclease/exonuclease/phosphatase family metal-dependent hydrolase